MSNRSPGAAIRRVRRSAGRSLRGFAADLGVSPSTLSTLERGLVPTTAARLQRAADLLGVSTTELLASDDPAGPEGEAAVPMRSWRDYDVVSMDPVLTAATRLFVRHGFHATSMRQIAARANLSVAGVYHHYPSKEQILATILDLTMDEVGWRVEAARQEGCDPVESFALMVESLALFHARRADLAFLGSSEMRALATADRTRITGLRNDVQHSLDRQAVECAKAGAFRAGDLRVGTRAVSTMCTSLPSWFHADGALDATEVAKQYAQFAVRVLSRP